MSEVHIEEHSTPIQTPRQLIVVVLLAFLVPILLIVMVVQLVTGGMKVDPRSAVMSDEAVAKRLKPVGEVVVGEIAAAAPVPTTPPPPPAAGNAMAAKAAAPTGKPDGGKVYQTACAMCHGTGLAGAPKFGDKAAWKPRIGQGLATLHEHAIKGIRTMPAKGANPSLSDAEVSAAVDYMVNQSK